MLPKINKNEILYLSFNNDRTCLSLGMQTGYRIYNLTKKDSLSFYERIFGKGIGLIEMLEKTNILGLVGGGVEAFEMPNKLNIYDDKEGKCIAYLSFKGDILNIRLKKDKILVICEHFIYLIDTVKFNSFDTIELGYDKKNTISFAFTLEPGIDKLAYNDTNEEKNKIIINTYEKENKLNSLELKANFESDNVISFMEFDKEGKLLAVAAKNNNYILLFRTDNGTPICKCNINNKLIHSLYLSFEQDSDFLCASLYCGEILIFNIQSINNVLNNDLNDNRKPIKEEIWSKFYLPEKKSICTFGGYEIGKDHIICFGVKGNYYLVKYDSSKRNELSLKIKEENIFKIDN